MSTAANALFGILVLFLGRRLFWVFVAVAGFVVGFNLAEQLVGAEAAAWLLLAIGVVGGIIGALLAVFAQRLAVAVAGFIAGGYLLLYLMGAVRAAGDGTLGTVLFIVGGVIGAVLVSALLDPALIVLSSALGATLLTQAAGQYFQLTPALNGIVFVVLLALGVAVQWGTWDRTEIREREIRD
jgi:hypothetical protein